MDTETRDIQLGSPGNGTDPDDPTGSIERDGEDSTGDRPAASSSPLRSVRDRIAAARKKRFADIDTPWIEGYFVRYQPIREERREGIVKKRRKLKDEQLLLMSADILASCCVGIFERTTDDERVSFDPSDPHGAYIDDDGNVVGDPLTFGHPRAAELIGVEPGNAVRAVRGYYASDGDIISVADQVVELSGYVRRDLSEGDAGNL